MRLEGWGYTCTASSVGGCTQGMRHHCLDWKTSLSQTENGKSCLTWDNMEVAVPPWSGSKIPGPAAGGR